MMPLSFQQLPLSSWGAFRGRRRVSDSPYIESIWEGVAQRGGVHFTAADAAIDIVCLKKNGVSRVLLSGPTNKAYLEQFDAGDEALTIRLRIGVYLPSRPGIRLINTDILLPSAGDGRFWLDGVGIALPSFDTAEVFVEYLAKKGLLQRNTLMERALEGQLLPSALRTMQRHSLATIGLTMSGIRQIKRAERARALLASDSPLTRVAYDAGYSNPGHMTTAFKHFFGYTPSTLRTLMRQDG